MPTLVIRPVDPLDDADMDAFQEVYAAAERAEDPDTPLYSREDAVAMLSSRDGGYRWDGFGAFLGDTMVGESLVTGDSRADVRTARLWIWVDPHHARRGVGTQLVAHGEQQLRSWGRAVCQAQTRIGADRSGPNRRFAERLGYTLVNTEVERRLALPADPTLLERLAADAAPHHTAYDVRVVVGPVPPDLAPSYVALKNRLSLEAPSGELDVEAGQDTVAELAAQDRDLRASGRTRVGAYALDGSGEVVGYAVAAASADGADHVDQWGTLVHPAHRGHRLGMAVKCAQLRAIGERFPTKRLITTTNAETNRQMVAINEALGFEVREIVGDFQKQLTDPETPGHGADPR
ncbi:GNAT family N-acetyltransferase [Nocardioides cynanchi]|uniref:GNAT family N-acetyltransferase n=1 Tax=Nocardioides cynanchi TaxID=2558918 RepID=UPI0012450DDE|nr:GNAT family N-acetyltransferase [Nocardioides cynanchi]